MPAAISPKSVAENLAELWSPRVIAEVDDCYVKVARVQGEFAWHAHQDEDELFYILAGELTIELEGDSVQLKPGDLYVVPKGVRHRPIAEQECQLMLIERKSTLHTGDVQTKLTRTIEEQLGD